MFLPPRVCIVGSRRSNPSVPCRNLFSFLRPFPRGMSWVRVFTWCRRRRRFLKGYAIIDAITTELINLVRSLARCHPCGTYTNTVPCRSRDWACSRYTAELARAFPTKRATMELYGLLGSARVIGKFDEFHLVERSFFPNANKNPSLALTFRKIKYKMHPPRKFKLIKKSRSHALLRSKCPWNPLRTYGKQFLPSMIHGLLGEGRPRRKAAPCQIELFIIYWSRFFNFFTFDCRAVFPAFKPHSFGHFYDPVYLRNVPRNNLQMAIVKGAYHTWSSSHPLASREKLECFPSPQTERISLSQTYFKIGK